MREFIVVKDTDFRLGPSGNLHLINKDVTIPARDIKTRIRIMEKLNGTRIEKTAFYFYSKAINKVLYKIIQEGIYYT